MQATGEATSEEERHRTGSAGPCGPARSRLRRALAEASARSGFDQVTVVELVARAGVSRSTFYRHYPDKFALLREVAEPAVSRLHATPCDQDPSSPHVAEQSVLDFLEQVQHDFVLYHSLLLQRPSLWFQRWLCREFSSPSWMRGDPLVCTARGWALLGVLSHWLEHGAGEPVERVARCYLELCHPSVHPGIASTA